MQFYGASIFCQTATVILSLRDRLLGIAMRSISLQALYYPSTQNRRILFVIPGLFFWWEPLLHRELSCDSVISWVSQLHILESCSSKTTFINLNGGVTSFSITTRARSHFFPFAKYSASSRYSSLLTLKIPMSENGICGSFIVLYCYKFSHKQTQPTNVRLNAV